MMTRFHFEAGALVRRQVLAVLKQMAWDEHATYTLDHDGGWLSRVYYVTATGEGAERLMTRFHEWMRVVNAAE